MTYNVPPPEQRGYCAEPGGTRHRLCQRRVVKEYAFCKEKCTIDSNCKGYSIFPFAEYNLCRIYTTSDCPSGWQQTNGDHTTGPLQTIANPGEDGCFVKNRLGK